MTAFPITIGAFFFFLVPGFIWAEVLRFRAKSFWKMMALSLAVTLGIETVLLPLPFLFRGPIHIWIAGLLIVSAAGAVIVARRRELKFMPAVGDLLNTPNLIILGVTVLMSAVAYRWGENITDIDGEKLIHLTYLRYYYAMPMSINGLSVLPGHPPPNFVHLWEYILAGWAHFSGVDPLDLYYRSRFVIPVLGLSGLCYWVQALFQSRQKALVLCFTVLFMCLGGFGLWATPSLEWIRNDPLRGLFGFMGSAHHADTAMEILLPLNAALIVLAFRDFRRKNLILFGVVLAATFMWHVREFFHLAVYLGIFGAVLAMVHPQGLRRWAVLWIPFAAVGMIAVVLNPATPELGYEMKIKEVALSYAALPENLLGLRVLFHFPADLRLTVGLNHNAIVRSDYIGAVFKDGWVFSPWLLLSVLVLPVIYFIGEKIDKLLALFYALLLALFCSNAAMLLLIVLTYSEINFTTPRMFYLFSFLLIADAFYLVAWRIYGKRKKALLLAVLTGLLLFLPLIGGNAKYFVQKRSTDWYGSSNPFGFSPPMIDFIKALPPKQTVLVNPSGLAALSVYAPHYLAVLPGVMGVTVRGRETEQPIFNTNDIRHDLTAQWLSSRRVRFIVVQRDHYTKLYPYFYSLPGVYRIVFDNREQQEMVVSYGA